MASNLDEIYEFLNDACIDPIKNSNESISYKLNSHEKIINVNIESQDQGRRLKITSFFCAPDDNEITDENIEDIFSTLNDFNEESLSGQWSIDDFGKLKVQFIIFLEDMALSRRQLSRINMTLINYAFFEAQALQIQACFGRSFRPYSFGVSGAAVKALIDSPQSIDLICNLINATTNERELFRLIVNRQHQPNHSY